MIKMDRPQTLRNQGKGHLSDGQGREDDRHLTAAIKEHGRHALGRLHVQWAWALQDAAEATGPTRRAMKQARAERLERVIADLRRTGRGQ